MRARPQDPRVGWEGGPGGGHRVSQQLRVSSCTHGVERARLAVAET